MNLVTPVEKMLAEDLEQAWLYARTTITMKQSVGESLFEDCFIKTALDHLAEAGVSFGRRRNNGWKDAKTVDGHIVQALENLDIVNNNLRRHDGE